ncbi:unnamed protein product [Ectocarpus sp. 13 AM-2016]
MNEVSTVGPTERRRAVPGRKSGLPRKREHPEQLEVTVPVVFKQHLGSGDAAHVVIEVLRHVLFMRGQLPMPFQQLVKVLDEREGRDEVNRQQKSTAAAAAAAAAALAAREVRGRTREGGDALGSGLTGTVGRRRSKKAKSGRPLAKAPPHRRARKSLRALAETTLAVEEAFADAARKGRPVLEALVLLGASHLSPREIYSVTFTRSSPDDGSEIKGTARRNSASGGHVRGKSSLADAYSRTLVRSMVGKMSSMPLPGLGSCRVHLFLRIAEGPVQDIRTAVQVANETMVEASSTLTSKTMASTASTRSSVNSGGSSSTGPPPGNSIVQRLTPRPGFKIRISRTRPAPKVSVVLSKRPPNVTDQSQGTGALGTCSASKAREGQQQHGKDGEWRPKAQPSRGHLTVPSP